MGWAVRTLMHLSKVHVLARRIFQGVELDHALEPFTRQEKVQSFMLMKVTQPLYALTDWLLFSKIRATIGIRGCVVSGGGSLAKGLDDFFEVIGLEVPPWCKHINKK
eukprot:3300014-Pyramimonas_sp.AAC.1